MNGWQVVKEIRKRLRDAVWPDAGGLRVFAAVHITAAVEDETLEKLRSPSVLIGVGSEQADPEFQEEPNLIEFQVPIRIVASVAGDGLGENVLIGANRTGGVIASEGRGIQELEEELKRTISTLNDLEGVRILWVYSSAADAQLGITSYHGHRSYLFTAQLTADRFYHPPERPAASDVGGGSAKVDWALPPARYDRLRIRVRRTTSPTAPPLLITDGVEVALSGDLAVTVTDPVGAGTHNYGIFAVYDETHDPPSVEERFSEPASVTVVVA